ncbi:MAG TPA: hypothetical protein VMT08_08785 [Bradyrhizobium sp.]|nr:hypothetical protein [Bradyrhizobium sp.]
MNTAKHEIASHPAHLRVGDGLDHGFQAAIDTPQGAAHPVAASYMRPGKPVIARRLLAKFVVAGK